MIRDTEYEILALGLMVNNQEAAYVGTSELDAECFLDLNHRTLFHCVCTLVENEKEINLYTVNQQLKDIGQVFSFEELISIEDKFYFPEKFQTIVTYLLDRKKKLLGIEKIRLIEDKLKNSSDDYEDCIKEVSSLYHLSVNKTTEIINGRNYIEIREKQDSERSRRAELKTFLPELDDNLTYKLGLGEISIIGARPSNGKSLLKTNIINNVCSRTEFGVVNYALEQTTLVESDRLEALVSGIPISEIALNYLWEKTDPRWETLREARKTIASWNYNLIQGFNKTTNEIRSELRILKQDGVKLVFWDLFDRLKEVSESTANKPQMIAKVCQQYLSLANELEMHFCFLLQMNRETAKKKDPRPSLHELKEAGAYEEVARLVLLLHSPGHYDPGLLNPPLEVDIAKQSNGKRTKVNLHFDPASLLLGGEKVSGLKPKMKLLKNDRPES